jgi:hypothetical protein
LLKDYARLLRVSGRPGEAAPIEARAERLAGAGNRRLAGGARAQ